MIRTIQYTEVGQNWHIKGKRVVEMTRDELLQAIVHLVNEQEVMKSREYQALLKNVHSTQEW